METKLYVAKRKWTWHELRFGGYCGRCGSRVPLSADGTLHVVCNSCGLRYRSRTGRRWVADGAERVVYVVIAVAKPRHHKGWIWRCPACGFDVTAGKGIVCRCLPARQWQMSLTGAPAARVVGQ